jgi:hypothetical protein
MSNCQTYFLSGVVDNLMIDRAISKKKYFAAYMVMAKKEWQKLFRGTLWEVQSKWMPMKNGEPYNYVDVPDGTSRILSVSVEDRCGLIQPLFYNVQLNVVSKPKTKNCGCKQDCNCGGCCEAASSMSYTTKVVLTINGVDYYEKTWIESCPNGDMIEYRETPTKKYNNIQGDGGDYNDDYNNDYDIEAAPFSDYTVVTVKSQKKICSVEVLPCGCVAETPENEQLLTDTCGCSINWGCGLKKKHCRHYTENINNNYYGECKMSECGTKIYYKPSLHWKKVSDVEFPEFLLVNTQSNGLIPNEEVLVPDYALDALEAGIYWRSVRFNTSIPKVTKDDAYQQYMMETSLLTAFLYPISWIELGQVQNAVIRW